MNPSHDRCNFETVQGITEMDPGFTYTDTNGYHHHPLNSYKRHCTVCFGVADLRCHEKDLKNSKVKFSNHPEYFILKSLTKKTQIVKTQITQNISFSNHSLKKLKFSNR